MSSIVFDPIFHIQKLQPRTVGHGTFYATTGFLFLNSGDKIKDISLQQRYDILFNGYFLTNQWNVFNQIRSLIGWDLYFEQYNVL